MAIAHEIVDVPKQQEQAAFIVLKVWEEKLEGGRIEWRGQALHLNSGNVTAFEDWPEMVDFIASALTDDSQ